MRFIQFCFIRKIALRSADINTKLQAGSTERPLGQYIRLRFMFIAAAAAAVVVVIVVVVVFMKQDIEYV